MHELAIADPMAAQEARFIDGTVPSKKELRVRIEAKIEEARRTLMEAANAVGLHSDQEAEYRRILRALDELHHRVQTAFADADHTAPAAGGAGRTARGHEDSR